MGAKILGFIKRNKWLIGFNLLGIYLFVKMAEDVIDKEYILVIDRWISIHINDVHTPLLNELMIILTSLNGGVGIVTFSICSILFLAYKKWYSDLWFYLLSVGGAAIAFTSIKLIVQRVRPGSDLLHVASYSFPSGHATMATAVALAVYFIFAKRVHLASLRMLLLIVCAAWIFIISFSRVYLDVHWLSDVIAGFGLGLFWITLLTAWNKLYEDK
jgi:membrane-associated phospholipid phosphatase